jgi:dihydropteroate synthase
MEGEFLKPGKKPLIMGILNVTPDSFSDGGKFFDADVAVSHAEKMAADGADIIDIGGESTRPFSDSVSTDEELRRVIPIIEKIAPCIPTPISIDTTKSIVAQHALDAGATIINDISALRMDPEIAHIAAKNDAQLILMHMKGTPKNMQVSPTYTDLFGEIISFLDKAVTSALAKGVARSRIIIDPGIGFGKTIQHNLMILKGLERLKALGLQVLIGLSRKAFIRKIVKPHNMKDIDPLLPVVETGTQAAIAAAVMNGADIVRVHDVAGTCATLKVICAIINGEY